MIIFIIILTGISFICLAVMPLFYMLKIKKIDKSMFYLDLFSKRMEYLINSHISTTIGVVAGGIALLLIYIN